MSYSANYELGLEPVSTGAAVGGIISGAKKIFGGLFGKKKKAACYNPCTGEKVGTNTLGRGCDDDFPGSVREQYIAERRAKIQCSTSGEPLSPGGISWKELAASSGVPKGATFSRPTYQPSNSGGGIFDITESKNGSRPSDESKGLLGIEGIDKNLLIWGGLAILAISLLKK